MRKLLVLPLFFMTHIALADPRTSVTETHHWQYLDQVSQATALVVDQGAIHSENGFTKIYTRSLVSRFGLCEDQKFRSELSVHNGCTAFLIAPDKLITSSQCVLGPRDCSSKKFVFSVTDVQSLSSLNGADIYNCKSVDGNLGNNVFGEYRVVTLDRPVTGIAPLIVSERDSAIGDKVAMVSHPHGLGQKYSESFVWETDHKWNRFRAGLPTMPGGIGGAIVDYETGEVVGVLQSSLNNSVRNNPFRGCNEYRMCSGKDCFLEIIGSARLFRHL